MPQKKVFELTFLPDIHFLYCFFFYNKLTVLSNLQDPWLKYLLHDYTESTQEITATSWVKFTQLKVDASAYRFRKPGASDGLSGGLAI